MDPIDNSRSVDDDHVVITLRGVGELQPHNPANRVTLSEDTDEFGVRRAFVSLGDPRDPAQPGRDDPDDQRPGARGTPWTTWPTTYGRSSSGRPTSDDRRPQPRRPRHDPPRGRHAVDGHRPRRVGDDARRRASTTSSTPTPSARPSCPPSAHPARCCPASPWPAASATTSWPRRRRRHLEDGFVWLFDGTAASFADWLQAGPGSMFLDEDEGVVTARPGS